MKLEFPGDFPRILMSDFMKTRPVGVEFHVDGQADRRDEASDCFSQFCE
jgi:hypothetical protein